MPIQILMPALSPTMTEGTLARWLKAEGDAIKAGQVIAEIETDKATMEVEAVDEGVLGKIIIPAGTAGVKVNEPIAILLGEGESMADAAKPTAAAPAPAPVAAAPVAAAPAAAAPVASASSAGRVVASPLAKRLAEQAGLSLSGVRGSGPNGRIVKADVEALIAAGPAAPAPAVAAPAPVVAAAPAAAPVAAAPAPKPAAPPPGQAFDMVPHTSMRKVIARRLQESKQTVPHFYLTVDLALDALMALRADLNAKGEKLGIKLSVNDFVIRAVALAMKQKPDVNAAWSDEGMLRFKQVDVSVAVAIPGGLITPIIKNADQKALGQISQEMKDLAKRARDGKLMPEEYQGGGFSISNLGMYGIKQFSAIINPPQSCILAVGAGEQRPVVKNGALAVETQMTCTLSVDHRVVDGALGAEFLQVLKGLIEDPLTMML
ncbi:MAG: pyruvate dehydrogenase complex dihydrolipoamide acetyltransferase [Alphaproteobacteria bacterium]|nr:pyruvate dehydrogenase complex dihydrolipoamide acetyltransferase [Alphaproteobacteria bacterium]